MAGVLETCLESTFAAFIEIICKEAVAKNACDVCGGAFWDPLVEAIVGMVVGGK